MRYQAFCDDSYISQSILAANMETVNWYPERVETPAGKADQVLYPTPGFQSFCTAGNNLGGRAMATMNGRTFAVMGGQLGELSSAQTFAAYGGALAVDQNLAQLTFNGKTGNQLLASSGGNGYSLALSTNTLTQVLTGKATQVGMLDGYGIAFDTTTGRIWLSAINDFTTWDPTQFLARSDAPDSWKAMIVVPPDVWMIGSLSGSILYDAGSFPFPLAPRPGLNFKFGIVAPFSLAVSGYNLMWLSQNPEGQGIVVRTRGYQPQRVSTYALEQIIAGYARNFTIGDAEAFMYQDRGHTFYVLNFPTANATHVYDLDLNKWHKRAYWNGPLNREDAWRPRVHTFAFGQHLTGDRTTNTIATMDVNYATELDGTSIRRRRRAPGIFSEHRQIPIRNIDVYLESGTSLQSGQGSDAVFMWQTSDDGGQTWGNQRFQHIGLTGQYNALLRMWGFGVPRDRVNELIVSDPLNTWRITDAYINNDAPPQAQGRAR